KAKAPAGKTAIGNNPKIPINYSDIATGLKIAIFFPGAGYEHQDQTDLGLWRIHLDFGGGDPGDLSHPQ
ncbi:MAG: hypothetical protein WAK96_06455, partial [Desulfobaccales bacterium]